MLEVKNFNEYFENIVKKYGSNSCLTDGKTGNSYSYKEVNKIVNKYVNFLLDLGIKKDDKFGILMENCLEFFWLYLASMKIGTLIVPLAVDTPALRLKKLIEERGIKLIFVDGKRRDLFLESESDVKYFIISELNEKIEKYSCDFPDIETSIDNPGSLYYSSGTTGIPKGIPQSPKNLLFAGEALIKAYGFNETDTQMGVLPCYHTALVTYGFWPGFVVGSNFVLFPKFSKSNFWKDLARYKIRFVETVPTVLYMLMNPPDDVSDLSSLKFIGSGSAYLSPEFHKRFEDHFNVLICNKYGLSETGPTHFNPPEREERKEGSIGRPLDMCEVKIVDEKNERCKVGETGEIVMKGENIVSGYYKDEEATKKAFRNGWFYTGDLAYKDNDNFYFIIGRTKEVIIRGGANIYPNEVDTILLSCDGVAEAASYGVPDKIYGEEIYADIVVSKDIKEEDIIEYCKKHLDAYKCPKKIRIVDKIPKTASGKILRRKILEEFLKQ